MDATVPLRQSELWIKICQVQNYIKAGVGGFEFMMKLEAWQ